MASENLHQLCLDQFPAGLNFNMIIMLLWDGENDGLIYYKKGSKLPIAKPEEEVHCSPYLLSSGKSGTNGVME